jgi:hypothetical protein
LFSILIDGLINHPMEVRIPYDFSVVKDFGWQQTIGGTAVSGGG